LTYLLVRLVLALGVADLGLEVFLLGEDEVADAGEVRELGVCTKGRQRAVLRRKEEGDEPVSTFILTTPFSTAVLISSLVEPEPPWKTR
jgi:hypothetical protein